MPYAARVPQEAVKKRGRPPAGIREAIAAAALQLIEEDGLGRLTTKEVAERAGASEASVYYHFKDKVGLVQAVVELGLEPVREINATEFGRLVDRPLTEGLDEISRAFERFFTRVMPVFAAIQGDADLRQEFGRRMSAQNLGPHRGFEAIAAFLTGQQARGRVRADVDVEAVGLELIGSCFVRTFMSHLLGKPELVPGRERTARALASLLEAHE